MKKTISFSIEEDIIKYIDNYKDSNNLSSRSAALERIVLNSKYICLEEVVKSIVSGLDLKKEEIIKVDTIKDEFDDNIADSFDSMPD